MALLELTRVSAGYGPITVLDELSLAVDHGEIVALLGANGSGKSTAIKTIIGLTQLRGGAISFGGTDVAQLPAHRRAALGLGYVPQTQNVFGDLTVEDNLRMGAYLRPREWADDAAGVFALFPRLQERRRTLARSLSGGERRMLALGLALLLQPKLLLLDEPSSDLAPATVEAVFRAIERIHAERHVPILLVEQNVAAALTLGRRVCVLVRGRVALDVPTARLDLEHLRRLFLEGSVAPAEPHRPTPLNGAPQ